MFYDRLLQLCESEGIKPSKLLLNLGMSKGSLANWKEGKLPTGEMLVRFSEHFGVSIDYLVFGTNVRSIVSEEDKEWLSLIHKLPKERREHYMTKFEGYVEAYEELNAPIQNRKAK